MDQASTVYSNFLPRYHLSFSISLMTKGHSQFVLKRGKKARLEGASHEPGALQFYIHVGGIGLPLRAETNTNMVYQAQIRKLRLRVLRNC